MLVKNTIIALMAVAPVLSIPVPATVKSTNTVATTKATTVKPTTERVSRAAVTKAESNVDRDVATGKRLRAQLKAVDAKLATDRTSARKLEKAELAQEKADKVAAKAKTQKSKLAKSKTPTTPTTKHSPKMVKMKSPSTKSLTPEERLARKQSLQHHSTHHKQHLTTGGGHRNKHNLRVDTTGHAYKHSSHHGLTTPETGRTGKLTGHRVTTPGSARTSKLTGHSVTTPGSTRTPLSSALGTGQSQFALGGPPTGFQSPGFSPPISGKLSGMTEDITWTPTTGGGYKESIEWKQPSSAKQLTRRALTPTTPVAPPLSPLDALTQRQKSRKSSKLHKHTVSETMQLSAMLLEAEKVVNGLEEQMNKPHTVFANLKRKSKKAVTPKTPATPTTVN